MEQTAWWLWPLLVTLMALYWWGMNARTLVKSRPQGLSIFELTMCTLMAGISIFFIVVIWTVAFLVKHVSGT